MAYINPDALTWEQRLKRAYKRRPAKWGPLCWNYCTPSGVYSQHFGALQATQCAMWECRCPCHRTPTTEGQVA